eukprot:4986711-Lingulodinium_polyedra.AAC.1
MGRARGSAADLNPSPCTAATAPTPCTRGARCARVGAASTVRRPPTAVKTPAPRPRAGPPATSRASSS